MTAKLVLSLISFCQYAEEEWLWISTTIENSNNFELNGSRCNKGPVTISFVIFDEHEITLIILSVVLCIDKRTHEQTYSDIIH